MSKENRPLEDEPFSHRVTKDGRVRIAYRGKTVTTLAGAEARTFRARMEGAGPEEAQLLMAKATKNFKRGNERSAGDKR